MGVMNVKTGTKAFGNTSGNSSANNNQVSNLSATDMKKLNADDVGEVLNKVADPNWVDPSKKMRSVGNDKLDKDAFFKLMLAQLKNQDPTNPLQPHEMSAQLANFSSLEQMTNINQTLTEMKNGQKPTEQFQALSLIGKSVAGDSSKLTRAVGDKEHDFKFALPTDASDVVVKLKNSDGEVVRTYNLKNLKHGDNKITWNGENDKGVKAPAGEYQFFAEAKNSSGGKLNVKTDFNGVITGINYTPEGPVLLIGNQTVRLRDVKKITDPSLMNNDQNVQNVNAQDLKNPMQMNETNNKEAKSVVAASSDAGAPEPQQKSKIMDQVGLSGEMMQKIAKETSL